jgi:hypothetical protein
LISHLGTGVITFFAHSREVRGAAVMRGSRTCSGEISDLWTFLHTSLTKMWSLQSAENFQRGPDMTDDVSRLLEQLGQPDLEYRVFKERVETPGYWPIFRLIQANPALARLPGAQRRSIGPDRAAPVAPPAKEWSGIDRRVGGPGKLFRRYGEAQAPVPPAPDEPTDDIRGLLRRLSE